jgi:hypothetical protein
MPSMKRRSTGQAPIGAWSAREKSPTPRHVGSPIQVTHLSSKMPANGYRSVTEIESIPCQCGARVPIPENGAHDRSVTTPCLKCKTHWTFHYDEHGHYLYFHQAGIAPD